MFPIPLSAIREAYRVTELTPHPGVWFAQNLTGPCSCPAGAMFAHLYGLAALEALVRLEDDEDSDLDVEQALADGLGLTKAQLVSFSAGFDLVGADPATMTDECRQAFFAGVAAREELCPLKVREEVTR